MMTPRLPSNRVGQNAESRVQMSPVLPDNCVRFVFIAVAPPFTELCLLKWQY